MNWVSFFFGAFVGFIVEWVIDLFYWRRQHGQTAAELDAARAEMRDMDARFQESLRTTKAAEREMEAARASLTSTTNELNILKEQLAGAQAAGETAVAQLAECREHLQANEADVAQLTARLGEADETIATLRAELQAAQAEVSTLAQKLAAMETTATDATRNVVAEAENDAAAPPPPDNLTKIEGVGPKIAGLLNQAGIMTFAQLAQAEVGHLQGILAEGGPRFQLADPGSWPEQATLAAAGDWEALRRLQDNLKGGRSARDAAQPL
ncbi:MAG: hypothetical protein KC418_08695 [Anaerolineales bacterium]|nr:hypothetical protein [Anaerolineales bacterium]MCB8950555.1 hypothetical protein [Ardenticatenales bacterium]